MTKEDFDDLVFEMEMMIIEAFGWPVALIADPKILSEVFADKVPTEIKLQGTLEVVPVKVGKPGQLLLQPSNLLDGSIK